MAKQTANVDVEFQQRRDTTDVADSGDLRREYQRDRARIVHSAAFRRLQGKTQVMGAGEGDFHRTRLTHSIEVGQVGVSLLQQLWRKRRPQTASPNWLPTGDLVLASCLAHDLGHPPFGHGGEKALNDRMKDCGGFEGNGQTLRILTRLEKYRLGQGINPTRRLVLSILKYPVPFSAFDKERHSTKPPKCFLDTESDIVEWALAPFPQSDRDLIRRLSDSGKPLHRTLDASIMECADDIAYGVHDLEDIVARRLVSREEVLASLDKSALRANQLSASAFDRALFGGGSTDRKQFIERLVGLFVQSVEWIEVPEFQHPLLKFRASIPPKQRRLLDCLQEITYDLVIGRAAVKQLERRGQRVVSQLFDELLSDPHALIPVESWKSLPEVDTVSRRVCDYLAGMTDAYAERLYRRLFTPGFGSSRDEL